MRRFCVDQANAFIAGGKKEHDLRERSAVRWLGRVPWPSPLTANTSQAAFKASLRADRVKP